MEHSVLSDFELQERKVARLKRERERRAMEDEVLQDVRTSLPTTPRKLIPCPFLFAQWIPH